MSLIKEGSRFVSASVAATAVQYLLLVAAVELLGIGAAVAAALAYMGGSATNYVLRRNFVFRSDTPHRQGIPRTIAVTAVGMAMNAIIMHLAHNVLGAPYLIAQVAATGLIFFWNFIAHRHWTFAPAVKPGAEPQPVLRSTGTIKREQPAFSQRLRAGL